VRRAGAAQQPDRAAPHTGVPEIGATLSGCCADAVEMRIGRWNTTHVRKRSGRMMFIYRNGLQPPLDGHC